MARFLVHATGYFFIFYGVAFVFLAAEMALLVTGGVPNTTSGLIDLRATYGGMSIAMGAIILILGSRKDSLSLALLTVAIVLLSMAVGRVVGMILDGAPNFFMWGYLVAELVVSTAALYLRATTPLNMR